ncbi:MAG: hypothetical protein OEU46_11585 [Alphaproteobacteria bacterium]|nr:hypothetical protein [Alphaproteobacteria bacterium]
MNRGDDTELSRAGAAPCMLRGKATDTSSTFPAMPAGDILLLDSVTRLDERHRGKVLVAGSHGGVYAAYLAALGQLRGVILNDAGIGKDRAGIGGLDYLDEAGIAAATISHLSARIGEGPDMMDRGVISHANKRAIALGCRPGMTCADCAALLMTGDIPTVPPPEIQEGRFLISADPGGPEVWGIDSNSLVLPEDRDRILITGSHGQVLGGKPETALKFDAVAAVYNDAGRGIDDAGISRLPALDARGIAAATVAHDSARIGDARSTYEDGIVSTLNETAAATRARTGIPTRALVDLLVAAWRDER